MVRPYLIGVFQPKQIKTIAIVCRPIEILCEAAENLTCARKLFQSLQFTVHDTSHHIYKQCLRKLQKRRGPGRHFGESQPKKLKSLNTLQLHLKSNAIRNTHRSINHRK